MKLRCVDVFLDILGKKHLSNRLLRLEGTLKLVQPAHFKDERTESERCSDSFQLHLSQVFLDMITLLNGLLKRFSITYNCS